MRYSQKTASRNELLLAIITFIIPTIGILAGLAATWMIIIFLLFSLLMIKRQIESWAWLSEIKLELVFLLWAGASAIWSIDTVSSIISFARISAIILVGMFVKHNIGLLESYYPKIQRTLIAGTVTAIMLFFIEYYLNGALSKSYRGIFQDQQEALFYFYMLDRGCALLSITAWVVIGILLNEHKYFIATIFYSLIFSVLLASDSLASFVAFAAAGLVFLLGRLVSIKILKLVSIFMIIGSLMMPVFAYLGNPSELAEKFTFLPYSAKHRLFIWNHIAKKSEDHLLLGIGINSSRMVSLTDSETTIYNNNQWSLLPLHPHNNVLQILFELGVVGLILFLALVYKTAAAIKKISKKHKNYALVSYACFINYYVIGMISYSIWQSWWVCSGIWVAIMMKWMLNRGAVGDLVEPGEISSPT